MSKRVVITGIGGVTPLGPSWQETWENALKGKSGIANITRFDAENYPTKIAGEVKGFEPADYFEAKEVKKVDAFSQFAVAAGGHALEASKILGKVKGERIGTILGVGIGGIRTLERNYETLLESGPRKVSPFLIPGMISNLAPGHIAIKYGLKGVNYTIQSACTSSTHAIGESYRMIAFGMYDAMVTGGSEATISPSAVAGFCSLRALSTRNDEPTRASRPFDKDRDGFVMAEGGVCLVLEELEHALARGAEIIAEVVGYGTSCDAHHITAPCVDGEGAVSSMRNALAAANLEPSQIEYINAHGTSTEANDKTETLAIKRVFSDTKELLVSSTKSMTGHMLGAAGAIEAGFCAMTLKYGKVLPTINLETPDPNCDLNYVPNQAVERRVEYALSNSFGFGGTNATLILKRYS